MVSMGVAATLFALLFKFLPDARIRWRDVWIGALMTAVLFEVGKFALGWYLGRESTANAYGSAGSIVLLLLWVYYASCILLFGAEFTQVYASSRGRLIQPVPEARRVKEIKVITDENEGPSVGQPHAGIPAAAAQRMEEEVPVPAPADRPPMVTAPAHEEGGSLFSHRLLDPVLKYLEGRGLLLSIEAKEAVSQIAFLLIVAAVCCVTLFVAWSMLATALVGLLVSSFGWSWIKAVAIAGGVHALVTLGGVLLIWRRARSGTWFKETFNELKKDRLWLRGKPH
jgi:uncharacterized membrane protein YqjE